MIHISREVHTVTQAPDWGLVFSEKLIIFVFGIKRVFLKQSSSGMLDIPGPLSIGGLSC